MTEALGARSWSYKSAPPAPPRVRGCAKSGVFRGKQGLPLHVKARGSMQVRSGNGKKKVHGQHFEGKSKKPDIIFCRLCDTAQRGVGGRGNKRLGQSESASSWNGLFRPPRPNHPVMLGTVSGVPELFQKNPPFFTPITYTWPNRTKLPIEEG